MSPPLDMDGTRTPPLAPLAVPAGWQAAKTSPPKDAKLWTVGTLVDSCLSLETIKDTYKLGIPTPEEQETLAAQAEEVTERLRMQLGGVAAEAADAGAAAEAADAGAAAAAAGRAQALQKQKQEVADFEEAAKGFGTQGSQRSEKTHGESFAANQEITKHALTSP
jgi:hypothetical protein